jgi:carotenoid 1,2-hydratase
MAAAGSLHGDVAMNARDFSSPVPPDGYHWWYVDALSDDGRHGLTIIAFIGSVFSPYYARARRRTPGAADPHDFCSVNVALYGDVRRWAMTERGRGEVRRSENHLMIGPSQLRWVGDALVIDLDEITTPLPSRLRGRVRVEAPALSREAFALDAEGRHLWSPIAPCARVTVTLDHPALEWQGDGYLDSNAGEIALERSFIRWHWSRSSLHGGDTAILYDVTRRDSSRTSLALRFGADGGFGRFDPPPEHALPDTMWRIGRATRSESPGAAPVARTLEDTPFYARSTVQTQLLGESVGSVHESLDLDRFSSRWVQTLLPFRMPRRRGRPASG